MRSTLVIFFVAAAAFLQGCDDGDGASAAAPEQDYTAFFTPLPEEPIFPASNAFSAEKARLGEFLFWDPILSGRMNVACASCHHPDHAWADGRTLSVGVDGSGLGPARTGEALTDLHSPTILNVAFTGLARTDPQEGFAAGGYFWDLRADSLEDQALEPIRSQVEMRSTDFLEEEILPEVLNRLKLIDEYRLLFEAAFDDVEPINEDNLARALATYQRTLITPRTRFDEFLAGDDTALTAREVTGLNKFINGGCADCHAGPMLSNNLIDLNRVILRDKPAVRTPSLRNVDLTAPYMHDGSHRTLRNAVARYEDRGDLDVTLEDDDFGDIEAFLRTLTTRGFPRDVPVYVPSQLPVGGDIF